MKSTKRSNFALVLKELRKNLGLTQQQIADALNVERSTYAYYETGTTRPSCEMVIKLSRFFYVDYRIFIEAIANAEILNNDEDKNYTNPCRKKLDFQQRITLWAG